jgi:CheY-like chemotaxis protein
VVLSWEAELALAPGRLYKGPILRNSRAILLLIRPKRYCSLSVSLRTAHRCAYVSSSGRSSVGGNPHRHGVPILLDRVQPQYGWAVRSQMRRILVVEDHALFREGLALLIELRTGHSSIQADSLAEARRILKDTRDKPICAIVDLHLPDGDGIELVEQLRELPVLALSTHQSPQWRNRVLEAGADEVLSKVAPVERILGTVNRLLEPGH